MKTDKSIISIYLISLIVLFVSCGIDSESNIYKEKKAEEIVPNYLLLTTTDVFHSLPSPVETAKLIMETEVKFDKEILNPVKNAPYYETSHAMALNLGVYSADVSFVSFFDQKQITMDYMSAVKLLADGLGLVNLLNKKDLIKIEENIYNRDSIKILINDVFFSSGEFLNDNNRPEIALLVEVGGWMEGLYIAMQLAKQSGHINKELVDRVAEQRSSLELVIKSLEKFSSLRSINTVLEDMKRLQVIYDKMVYPEGEKLGSNNDMKLTKHSKANVTPEIFLDLYHEIMRIRNSYTL